MKIQLKELECKQCGHKWKPRTERIHKCPNPKCQGMVNLILTMNKKGSK